MTRKMVARALGNIGADAAARDELTRTLTAAARSADWVTICAAAESLAQLGRMPKRAIGVLTDLLSSEEVETRGTAAIVLGELGPASVDAITSILERIKLEADRDVLYAMCNALIIILHSLGGEPNVDYSELFDVLSGRACDESSLDHLMILLSTIVSFGEMVVPMLIELARLKTIGSSRVVTSTLTVLGIAQGESVVTQIIEGLLQCEDTALRTVGTTVLAEMGPHARTAAYALAQLLDESNDVNHADTLRALRAIGPGAEVAADSIVRRLLNDDGVIGALASSALLAIGPAILPVLEAYSAQADEEGRKKLDVVRARIGTAVVARPKREFDWVGDDALLEMFVAVGEILESDGPTSYRELAKRIDVMKAAGRFKRINSTYYRQIASQVQKLETLLSDREGREVILRERDSTRKSGLTERGKKLLADLKR